MSGVRSLRPVEVVDLAPLEYEAALQLQEMWVKERRSGAIPDRLLFTEHPPVITLGRSTNPANLLETPEALRGRGIQVHEVGRGGDVTYHGPGQLVGYPILDLHPFQGGKDRRDLHAYLRDLEEVLIRTLADVSVHAWREPGRTGVWTEGGKVAALGVRVSSGWITSHGFALNVDTDLSAFSAIVPCGISDAPVASLSSLLMNPPTRHHVVGRLSHHFAEVFDAELHNVGGRVGKMDGSKV